MTVGAACAALLTALAVVIAAPTPQAGAAAAPACTPGTTVHTNDGSVCGVAANGQASYLDIPFAAPPVGKLRWTPPQSVRPWTTTYQATQPAPECPSAAIPGFAPLNTDEDCLFLEVQKPADVRPGQRLPVMVEFHGGGFLDTEPTNNGANLVSSGPVIYVFANYRLGILGFLADKALGPHSGDYGLLDQQAALRWVQGNIASFGGNPRNVTIFGESAGGASVCDQVASPTAKGLFERGISVSGFYNVNVNTIWWPADCKSNLPTEAQAQQMGGAFAAKVGCGSTVNALACLRKVPTTTLLADGGQVEAPFGGGVIGPVVNGTTLPVSPAEAFKLGRVNKVGLMIGVGRDEFNGGVNTNAFNTVVADTPGQYRQLVDQQFGSHAPAVMRLYPLERFPSPAPFTAYRTIMADAFSVCPALVTDAELAGHIPVYAYEDDDTDSPSTGETQPLGAYHSAINRLVHDAPSSLDPNQAALQSQVLAQWTGFARTGNPNVTGVPGWTPYSSGLARVMSLAPAGDSVLIPASEIAAQHNCGFWDSARNYQT